MTDREPQITISREAVPRPSFEVRRRRYGDGRWLVHHNAIYEIDALVDAVWLGCVDGLTVEQTIHRVAETHGLSLGDAIAATTAALGRLAALGFVDLDGDG